MIWLDYVMMAVIAFSCLLGLIRGLAKEALSLATWGCAFFITNRYYADLSNFFTSFKNELARKGIAIVFLFVATIILGTSIGSVIEKWIKRSLLSSVDRMLGICFGALRGTLVVATILFFFDTYAWFSKSEFWKKSKLVPEFIFIARCFLHYLQDFSDYLLGI